MNLRSASRSRLLRGGKELVQFCLQPIGFLGLALPHDENTPTCASKRASGDRIPGNVPFELVFPKSNVRRRHGRLPASLVSVPKATVNEDGGIVLRKNDVGLSRQIAPMNSESIAHRMKLSANDDFGGGILRSDLRHQV